VGLLENDQTVQRAVERLAQVGFRPDTYEVLHGDEDARSLDLEGTAHGLGGRLLRALQDLSSYDRDHTRRHVEHLQAGGYVLAVVVGDDEVAKLRAAEAMTENGGEFVNHYADTYIETL